MLITPSSAAVAIPAPVDAWQVRVLGGLEARRGDVVVTHFVSHAIAALLARLALWPRRTHAREELVELLWPGVELDVGRNRLRHAISTLRKLLEPSGVAPGSVLLADRHGVQLAADATRCDALDFERCVRAGRFAEARELYRGELLPGYYADWIDDERLRLAALHDGLDDLPAASPPVPSTTPSLLPAYLTSSYGRAVERQTLANEVVARRLVTLTGPGGCGKTRLAVETAQSVAGFDCIAYAALADCQSLAAAATQLHASLRLPPAAGDPLEQVVTMLAHGTPLVVLDNFEQLVLPGGAAWVERLLARVPALHLLVTSRRALGVPGEREFALAPLPLPEGVPDLAQTAGNASVALFVDRARAVRPDFELTGDNASAVAALCRALEGLPLAIELAASRSRAYAPRDMLAALSERYGWLARPGAAPMARRHDSLQATIAWSWQLLDGRTQRFLLSLSVFRGGWTAASAQAVCDEPDALALLEALVADSLVRSAPDAAGAMRFSMLDMIRAFLRERLDQEAARDLRRQHRAHFLAAALGLQARGVAWVEDAELPNLHEALRSAVDDGDPEVALSMALALRGEWESRGIAPEALALLQRALDAGEPMPGGADAMWVQACILVALLSLAAGQGAAAQSGAERALRHAGDAPVLRATALCAGARIAFERHVDAPDAMAQLDDALALAERAGAGDIAAQAISLQGIVTLRDRGDPAGAGALLADAHDRYLALGLAREAGQLLYERTLCLMELGRWADGLAQACRYEQECVAAGDRQRRLKAINLQGVLHAGMRDWRAAVAAYRRCAELAWQSHNHYWLGYALWNHGRNLARLRDPARAARLMAFSVRYWPMHFGPLDQHDLRYARQVRALVEHQLGAAETDMLWREGGALGLAQALDLARAVPA